MEGEGEVVCKLPRKLPIPELIAKSLKFLSLAVLIVWAVSHVFEFVLGIDRLYVFLLVGLLCSSLATYIQVQSMVRSKF